MRCIVDAALLTNADAPIKRIDEFSAEALPTTRASEPVILSAAGAKDLLWDLIPLQYLSPTVVP